MPDRSRDTATAHCPKTKKAIYETEIDARSGLAEVRARRQREGQPTAEKAVYRCGFCGRWHLTKHVGAI